MRRRLGRGALAFNPSTGPTTLPNVGAFADQAPMKIAGLPNLTVSSDMVVFWESGIHAYNTITMAVGKRISGGNYGITLWCNNLILNNAAGFVCDGMPGEDKVDDGPPESNDGTAGGNSLMGPGGGGGAYQNGGGGSPAYPYPYNFAATNGGSDIGNGGFAGSQGLAFGQQNVNYSQAVWGSGGDGSDASLGGGGGSAGGYGGGGGGGSEGDTDPDGVGTPGGGGGGGVILIVANSINLLGNGLFSASGGGGGLGSTEAYCAGCGGGGLIVVWAKKYKHAGTAVTSVGGGDSGYGNPGNDGTARIFQISRSNSVSLASFNGSWNNL